MADVVASSLVRLVCDKMGTKLMREYGLLSGADKELKKLEGILEMIRDVLDDAEARQEKDRALRGWLKKLKDVAFEIDDLLDDVSIEAAKSENKKKTGIIGKVCKLSALPNSVKFKYTIAHRVKGIMEKLDEIAAERSKFHLQVKMTTESNNREDIVIRESSSFVDESDVYGREEDKEKIIEFLVNTESKNGLGVITIVGMGGLGKTTIAKLVFNNQRMRDHFDQFIWVSVNENFDIRRIIKNILESTFTSNFDLSLESLQCKLKERLGGQRFLLVLDDVWNENSEKWDNLRGLLTIGAQGSKVIVTSRSTRVASIMGTVEPYILAGLSKDDCWLLFEKRAFTLATTSDTNSNLVMIGKQIVKKCGGVPLAAKVLGSLMRFKRKESEWLAIRDNDIWNISSVENEILPSLMLSYVNLPSHLKQCFAYCALFPKNEEIQISDLIQLWIAEGFIQSRVNREELKDVGKGFVEELLSRSLFQVGSMWGGETISCIKIHDLIHDMASYVAGEECSTIDTDGIITIGENARYSSLVYKKYGPLFGSLYPSGIPRKLRTLYLSTSLGIGCQKQEPQKDFLNTLCTNFILLRALFLRNYPLEEFPSSLGNLRHLRYLDLSDTKLKTLSSDISHLYSLRTLVLERCCYLEKLSDSIGKLCKLVELNLWGCNNLRSLPDSIGQLKSLKILDLSECPVESLPVCIVMLTNLKSLQLEHCYFLHELPNDIAEMRSLMHLGVDNFLECTPCGIGDLCYLRRMPIFVPGGKTKCSIRELGKLDLMGKLQIKCLENVKTPQEAKEAKLICKNDLRKLNLLWNLQSYAIQKENNSETEKEGKSNEELIELYIKQEYSVDIPLVEQVLENLQPPNMISSLEIEGYLGNMIPKWLTNLQLPNLVHITLEHCTNCKTLPEFKNFGCLKTLQLSFLMKISSLNSLGQIPSLEVLTLVCLPLVTCLGSEFYGGDVAFTKLVELELGCMPELNEWSEGAAGFEFLPRLTKLGIGMCPKLKKLPSTFSTVSRLEMCVDDELLLSSLRSGGFPNLKKMHLSLNKEDESLPEEIEVRWEALESSSMSW